MYLDSRDRQATTLAKTETGSDNSDNKNHRHNARRPRQKYQPGACISLFELVWACLGLLRLVCACRKIRKRDARTILICIHIYSIYRVAYALLYLAATGFETHVYGLLVFYNRLE